MIERKMLRLEKPQKQLGILYMMFKKCMIPIQTRKMDEFRTEWTSHSNWGIGSSIAIFEVCLDRVMMTRRSGDIYAI